MLMAVKNQLRVSLLSLKYSVMRELLNKITFLSNIIFMILNNACMIVEWIIIFSLKEEIGGYSFNEVLLLWGMASGTYGIAHFFFKKAFNLSDVIINGKLDAFIVQPKNILIQAITTDIEVSAIGDILFGYIMLFLYGISFSNFILFTTFIVTGGLILTSIAVLLNSLSFWINNADMIADVGGHLMVNSATYPDGIFKGVVKTLLFTLIPVGISNYIPVKIIITFNIKLFLINIIVCIALIGLSFLVFNNGIKKYSSSNLMSARI